MILWTGTLDRIAVTDARIEISTGYDVKMIVTRGTANARITGGKAIRLERSADGASHVDVAGETATVGEAAWTHTIADRARIAALEGTVTVKRWGEATPLDRRDTVGAGDHVLLADADASLKLQFTDKGRIALVGPAEFSIVQINTAGRRVMLGSGVIRYVEAQGIAFEIQTPHDAALVLQNAAGTIEVREDGVICSDVEGEYARVWTGGKLVELDNGGWSSAD